MKRLTQDETAQRQALDESEERYRLLVEGVKDYAIFMLDTEGRVLTWNEGAQRAKGYTSEEIIGQSMDRFYTPEDQAMGKPAAMLKTATEQDRVEEEGWMMRKDGSQFWADVVITAVLDREKQLIGYSEVSRDLSERKRAETERAGLTQARDIALDSVRHKSEFMANMSHEIRTPMNSIIGMAELLSETDLTSVQKEYVDIFRRSGEHLLTVINDVLDFSKVESGVFQLEETDFNLADVMENTLKLLAMRAQEKGLALAYHIAPDVPSFLSGDPDRLRQVITNVIGNAIKFTEKGDVLLRIENETPSEKNLPCRLQFSVTDTGIGIAPDKLDDVFESFVQGDSSITRKYGGTGLGLTISKKLVELMGGTIGVTSEPGKGSRFFFTIPFETPKAPPSRMAIPSLRNLKGVKTLIVDDNPANRFLAGQLLSARGLLVVEYENVDQGLKEIRRAQNTAHPYELLVVDLQMQGLSGFDMVKYLRTYRIHMAVVMVSSADPNQRNLARCRALGIPPPLVKPVKTEKLLETIRNAMDNAEQETPKGSSSVSSADAAERPLRILLVEDSSDNQMLVLAYLKKSNHTVDLADNGEIAVKKATESFYDLIFMDMQMPVMDGYTATRTIRSWESQNGKAQKAAPIIALTAYALKEEIEKSFRAGCTGHMTKPIKKSIFMDMIGQYAKKDSYAA